MSAREALVAATKELLAEDGYVRTSPRDILARSGAGQGSLYHHFRGKSELAGAALTEVSAEMRQATDDLLDDRDPLQAVRSWVTAPREALRGCRLGRLVAEPILDEADLRTPIASYFEHVQRRLASRLGEAETDGLLHPHLVPADLAAALVAVVQGGYVLARSSGDAGVMRRAQQAAATLLMCACAEAV